jgi:hypothetical protein
VTVFENNILKNIKKYFQFLFSGLTNTMVNIGSADVYSEPGHDALAEDYYQESGKTVLSLIIIKK